MNLIENNDDTLYQDDSCIESNNKPEKVEIIENKQENKPKKKSKHSYKTYFRYIFIVLMIGLTILMVFLSIYIQKKSHSVEDNKPFFEETNDTGVKLDDIIGYDECKQTLRFYIEAMKSDQKCNFSVPRGILLSGPPGNGKTMFAKALATECNCTFIYLNGADFESKWIGVGPKRVKELFKYARGKSPCIIYIDEFDSMTRARDEGIHHAHLQILNQFLTQMDGFNKNDKILVLASTNASKDSNNIDKALIREGRFSETIYLDYPNEDVREKLLNKCLNDLNNNNIDIKNIKNFSKAIVNTSCADIKGIVNKSNTRHYKEIFKKENKIVSDKPTITTDNLVQSYIDVKFGTSTSSIPDNLRVAVLYREIGHILVYNTLNKYSDVFYSTINPITYKSNVLYGYTQCYEKININQNDPEYLLYELIKAYSGICAEELFKGTSSLLSAQDENTIDNIINTIINKQISILGTKIDNNNEFKNKFKSQIKDICRKIILLNLGFKIDENKEITREEIVKNLNNLEIYNYLNNNNLVSFPNTSTKSEDYIISFKDDSFTMQKFDNIQNDISYRITINKAITTES